MQQMRPPSEQALPEWKREALDRARMEEGTNRAKNPAIWQKLEEIEAKLDRIFALLVSR